MLRAVFFASCLGIAQALRGHGVMGVDPSGQAVRDDDSVDDVHNLLSSLHARLASLEEKLNMNALVDAVSVLQKVATSTASRYPGQWTNGYGTCNTTPSFTGKDNPMFCVPGKGVTCAGYKNEGWCKDGAFVKKYSWTSGTSYKFPEKNCPVCGFKPEGGQWTNGYGACNTAPDFEGKDDKLSCIPGEGVTCAGYENEGWCRDGAITDKYKNAFTTWQTEFNRPADHCPVCGKPTCQAVEGYTDVGLGAGKLVGEGTRMGRKISGGDGPGEAKDVTSCQQKCAATEGCTDFDYCNNGTCSLWTSEAGKSITAKYDYYPLQNCRTYVCGPHYV